MSSQIINYCPCPFIKDKKTSPKKGISAGKIKTFIHKSNQKVRNGYHFKVRMLSFFRAQHLYSRSIYYSLDPSFLLSLPFSSVSVTPEHGSNLLLIGLPYFFCEWFIRPPLYIFFHPYFTFN